MTLMSGCTRCHLKLYARLIAVKLEGTAWNVCDCDMSFLSSKFHVSFCHGSFGTSVKMSFISFTRQNVLDDVKALTHRFGIV